MIIDEIKIKNCNNVYTPREDSYLLAECVEKYASGKVLDLGTGTGLQGIVAAKKGCDVTFADIDNNAIECAKSNADLNNVDGNFVNSDLFHNIGDKFNMIIFNPPYLPSDEKRHLALDGGKNGRELIDRFLDSYKNYLLKKHMVLLVESSFNNYNKDVKKLNAKVIGTVHYFFEDLVVLLFE